MGVAIKGKYNKCVKEIEAGNVSAIESGLQNLSELLSKHFNKKVWILVDEYDAAANFAYMTCKDIEEATEVSNLFRSILQAASKGNPYLEKGVLTGEQYIVKCGMLSGLNNLSKHNITCRQNSKYYGINNEEMEILLKAYSIGEK